jgi:hypothetical protein
MSEPEYVTKADLAEAMGEWRSAIDELKAASTPREKEEARAEVAEAREDLDALAQRMGISRETLERSMAEAKKAERRNELAPIVTELIEAYMDSLPDEDADSEGDGKGAKAGGSEKPGGNARSDPAKTGDTPAQPPAKPTPDTEPTAEHWSERAVSSLLR